MQGLPISWDPVLATAYQDFGGEVTWSPCNRLIAVATYATIEILDAATLERRNSFKFPRGTTYRRLGFSPDGRTLTQFDQEKFTSWNLRTGNPVDTVSLGDGRDMLPEKSSSVAYSMDGKILAVSNTSSHNPILINTYDLPSGTYTRSYRAPEGRIVAPIWTHHECLRFITVKPGSITTWEVSFTSAHAPATVESFHTPNEINDIGHENLLFLPPPLPTRLHCPRYGVCLGCPGFQVPSEVCTQFNLVLRRVPRDVVLLRWSLLFTHGQQSRNLRLEEVPR